MRPASFRASVEDYQSERDWSSGGILRTPEKSLHRIPHRSGIHRHVWRRCSLCVVGNRIGSPGPGHRTEIDEAPTGRYVTAFISMPSLVVGNLHCNYERECHLGSMIKLLLYVHATSPFWKLTARQKMLFSWLEKSLDSSRSQMNSRCFNPSE